MSILFRLLESIRPKSRRFALLLLRLVLQSQHVKRQAHDREDGEETAADDDETERPGQEVVIGTWEPLPVYIRLDSEETRR